MNNTSDPRPIAIGPKNCEALCGVPWRWLRDHTAELGIELVQIDGKRVALAAHVEAALAARASKAPANDASDANELNAWRARIARAGAA